MNIRNVCLVLSLVLASSASAIPMSLDGTWVMLDEIMSPGDFFADAYTWDSPWRVRFTVTAWPVVTDRFEVYDNAILVLTTPDMPDWDDLGFASPWVSPPYTMDPDVALASGVFSSGEILFAPGAHSITIRDIHIAPTLSGAPFPDGSVAFKAVEVIPAPGAVLLVGIGAGLAGWMRRRRTL